MSMPITAHNNVDVILLLRPIRGDCVVHFNVGRLEDVSDVVDIDVKAVLSKDLVMRIKFWRGAKGGTFIRSPL